MRTRVTIWDIAVLAAVLILAFLWFLLPMLREGATAVRVTVGNEESVVYPLTVEREIELGDKENGLLLHIGSEGVFVVHADCPDQVCVKTGTIAKSGEVIICAPAGIRVELVGGEDEVPDYVIG